MRHTLIFLAFLALALLPGCKSKCRSLSEKLCQCTVNSVERDDCLKRAASEEGRLPLTEADNAFCESLLAGCDCHTVGTTEGKRACGLAK